MSTALAPLETRMKNIRSLLVGNRVWFVNLRDRTRVIDAFTTLIKELYKPQSKYTYSRMCHRFTALRRTWSI